MKTTLVFRSEVSFEVGAELSQVDGVELDGNHLTCSPTGLFNLKSRGSTLFIADGGAVLVQPGRKMLMFQENQAG